MVLNDLAYLRAIEGLCDTLNHLNVGRKLSHLLGDVILEMFRAEEKLKDNCPDNTLDLPVLPVENTGGRKSKRKLMHSIFCS